MPRKPKNALPLELAPPKRGRGRPAHNPDLIEERRSVVSMMAGGGMHVDEIAAALKLAPNTVRRHYQKELEASASIANAQVVNALYRNATVHNNVTAQIWWTKTRMGWSEKVVVQDGGFAPDFDPRGLSDEDLAERLRTLRAAPAKDRGALH